MAASHKTLTIGVLAAAAGVNVETVRYYQRRGLLSEPARASGSIRRYDDEDVARLQFVKSAQRLGFSLDEIADLLALADGTHCSEARELAQRKLEDVRAKLDHLKSIETALARLVRDCSRARGTVSCPLIAALRHP